MSHSETWPDEKRLNTPSLTLAKWRPHHMRMWMLLFSLSLRASALSSQVLALPEGGWMEVPSAPLWELGMGVGGTYVPDYPGSAQNHLWAIPFPWGIYRGEILHSDRRGGTRARLLHSAGYEFNVSAAGGLPSSSAQNHARQGMPNLEFLGEAGPRLTLDLLSYPGGSLLRLGLPLRSAFSTNFKRFTGRGFLFGPELLYDDPNAFGTGVDAFVLFTTNFIDKRLAAYFYDVHPDYATAERPAYQARGGYLLSDLNFGVMLPLPFKGFRVYAYSSLQFLQGAANENSPLFRSSFNASVATVLIWTFAESHEHVVPED